MTEYKPGDKIQFTHEAEIALEVKGITEIISKSHRADSYFLKGHNTPFHKDWFTLVTKEETKGIKYDSDKLRFSLIPWNALKEVVKVLEFGAKKYAVDNWKQIEPQRYKDAAMRHLVAIMDDEWLDEESQLPHAAHCICCLLFIIWFKLNE